MKRSGGIALALAALLMAAVAALVGGCDRAESDTPPVQQLPRVVVIRPQRGEAVRSLTLPGDVVGYFQSALYAKVTGYLKQIFVDKGDRVKKGQVLAEIEVPELRERLDRARSNLEIQQLTYNRLDRVWKSDPRLVAREDVDIAYSKFQQAKAQADELAAMVSYTRIIAPFDGIVTERFVDPGALIKAGGQGGVSAPMEGTARAGGVAAPVVSVADIEKLRIYVYVPQDTVNYIRRGLPVTVTFRELPGRVYHASVTRFAHSLDLATRTMLTEIDLDNPRREIYPGMYANVVLDLERHPNAIKLPDSAVGNSSDGAHFVLVARHGRLVRVPVTVGIDTGIDVEITKGLTGDEEVVQTVSPAFSAGERVQAVLDNGYRLSWQAALAKPNSN
ncbi:MAG TPA: efflux RND transporter periplasmic adaptor subunit [Candidatus Binataceae bacterium]|jgi:multidrug efflux pump subunit AcrA (membrane-fusion protein)|nr:efflux RND transporter periplasmic adaptor subunit [Candidatus Binataceae bacterium]